MLQSRYIFLSFKLQVKNDISPIRGEVKLNQEVSNFVNIFESEVYWRVKSADLLLYYINMNTENIINSIYNPKKKGKESVFFPKICKQQTTPPYNKVFVRAASRKYNQQNIFKLQDDKKQRLKLHFEDEKFKEIQNRECEELEAKIADMLKRHQEELRDIQQTEKQVASKIQTSKKEHYQIKLNIWELKNEVMNLNGILLDEEAELQRLEALMPPDEGEYQQEEYMEEAEVQNEEEVDIRPEASNQQNVQNSIEQNQ